jgi:hypothetical protein
MKIYFEDCANYITAAGEHGIIVRCNFRYTDCRDDELLDDFIKRHGGEDKTVQYLKAAYSDTTNIAQ